MVQGNPKKRSIICLLVMVAVISEEFPMKPTTEHSKNMQTQGITATSTAITLSHLNLEAMNDLSSMLD